MNHLTKTEIELALTLGYTVRSTKTLHNGEINIWYRSINNRIYFSHNLGNSKKFQETDTNLTDFVGKVGDKRFYLAD